MRSVLKWAAAWVALWASWLLFQGEWNAIQNYAAASAATLCLVVALFVRRVAPPVVRGERRWLVRAARVPWLVVQEFWYITAFLFTGREGEFRRVEFPAGSAVEMLTGYSPNSYVVDVDENRGKVLVHVLRRVPRGEELT